MTDVVEMKRSNLVLPSSGYELDREEMSYVEGGDYYWSKQTCQNILALSGALAFYGSVAAILIGGTSLYYALYAFMGFAVTALSANPITAPIGLVVGGFLISKGIEFISCLVMGAAHNGMNIETLKFWIIDTGLPIGFSYSY